MAVKQTTITREELDQLFGRASNVREIGNLKQEGNLMAGRKGKRSTDESIRLIKEFIFASKKPVTFLDIMQHLGRKPAPHFRAMLDKMVSDGEVVKTSDYGAGPLIPRHLYRRAK